MQEMYTYKINVPEVQEVLITNVISCGGSQAIVNAIRDDEGYIVNMNSRVDGKHEHRFDNVGAALVFARGAVVDAERKRLLYEAVDAESGTTNLIEKISDQLLDERDMTMGEAKRYGLEQAARIVRSFFDNKGE